MLPAPYARLSTEHLTSLFIYSAQRTAFTQIPLQKKQALGVSMPRGLGAQLSPLLSHRSLGLGVLCCTLPPPSSHSRGNHTLRPQLPEGAVFPDWVFAQHSVPSPGGGIIYPRNSKMKSKSLSNCKSERKQAPVLHLPTQQGLLLILTSFPLAPALLLLEGK